jgi:hypothetical protein
MVILAQGIQLFEDIPWKMIAVPAIILGFLGATADSVARILQARQQRKLVKDIRDAVVRIHDMTAEILTVAGDTHETMLSTAKSVVYPSKKTGPGDG